MKPGRQIKVSSDIIREVMEMGLGPIAESIIDSIIGSGSVKKSKPKGMAQYKRDLFAALGVVSSDALDHVRVGFPNGKKIKFMENEHRLLLGEFEELPFKQQKLIKAQADLIIATQVADLEKAAKLQYSSSVSSGKTVAEVRFDMRNKTDKFIEGNALAAGSKALVAETVNTVRNAFFATPEAMKEIVAFKFVNDDPKTDICKDLNGTVYSVDDPDHFRYTPPLHFNCDSYITPIYELKKGQKIKKIKPSTSKLESSIQF